MPVLKLGSGDRNKEWGDGSLEMPSRAAGLSKLLSGVTGVCANRGCRSGWLQLFRSRTRPVFQGGWTCSGPCTEERVLLSLQRERIGWSPVTEPYQPRIPLGLLMLEQGLISAPQLRRAVEAQKRTGKLRIGEWLIKQGAADERSITRALSMQWGCPVLRLSEERTTVVAGLIPRLFLEAFKVLPVRTGGDKLLYLGFEGRRDAVLALAVERITGVRVESGIVQSSEYRSASERVCSDPFPPLQLIEAVSERAAAHTLARSIERAQPVDSRLVRVHKWLWLRMYLNGQNPVCPDRDSVRDVICTIEPFDSSNLIPRR